MIPPAWQRSGCRIVAALLLQHLAEAPLGEDALAGRDRQVRAAGDLGHDVVVLAAGTAPR